jgi:hypothetical protein
MKPLNTFCRKNAELLNVLVTAGLQRDRHGKLLEFFFLLIFMMFEVQRVRITIFGGMDGAGNKLIFHVLI